MISNATEGVVCCAVGGDRVAFRGRDVRLVARGEDMRLGEGPDGTIGVLHYAGATVPVYPLASLLGVPERHSLGANHIVVTSGAAGLYGVLSEHAARMAAADRATVLPLPEFIGSPADAWFDGMLHAGDLFCPLLSPSGLEPGGAAPRRHAAPPRPAPASSSAPPAAADLILTFRSAALPACDADRYAICGRQTAAVVQTLPFIALPGTPAFVKGVAPWRGAAVALVDFAGSGHGAAVRQLVVRASGGYAALPVEGDVTLLHASSGHRRIDTAASPFVTGVFDAEGERIALVDVNALVGIGGREMTASCAG